MRRGFDRLYQFIIKVVLHFAVTSWYMILFMHAAIKSHSNNNNKNKNNPPKEIEQTEQRMEQEDEGKKYVYIK